MIVFDTNVLSELTRPVPEPAWLDAQPATELATTAITAGGCATALPGCPAGAGEPAWRMRCGACSKSTRGIAWVHQVCWRFVGSAALIDEITPFGRACWPRQPEPRYYPGGATGRRLYAATPAPRAWLDPVAAEVWRAVAVHGLPLTVRALAAWWRIDDVDDVLARHRPPAIAAALVRTVAYRAGGGGRYDDAAGTFGVEVDAVRVAGTDVQRRLRLSENRPW